MTSRETKSLANTEDKSSGVSNDVLIESLRYQLAQLNPEERMEFGGQEMFNFVMRPVTILRIKRCLSSYYYISLV